MRHINVAVALITLFGLLLGNAGIASAKTVAHQAKVSHVVAHHVIKKLAVKKSTHKLTKHQTKKSGKLTSQHVTKHA